jgi:hypothetical protein
MVCDGLSRKSAKSTRQVRYVVFMTSTYPSSLLMYIILYRITHTPHSLYLYRVETRKELCTWICEQHNLVNQKLGKPVYSCDMKALDERWRKSSKEECQK